MTEIETFLYLFGIGPSYYGYRPLVLSLKLILENEDRLKCISRSVYPVIVARFGGSQSTVEHNLRTIANQAWKQNRALLEKISRRSFVKPPAAKLFVETLYIYIARHK